MRLAPLFTNIYFYFIYHVFVFIEQKSWETNNMDLFILS